MSEVEIYPTIINGMYRLDLQQWMFEDIVKAMNAKNKARERTNQWNIEKADRPGIPKKERLVIRSVPKENMQTSSTK